MSDNPWIFPTSGGDRSTGTALRTNMRFYVGDAEGHNVDHAPGDFSYGPYTYVWGNAITGAMHREPIDGFIGYRTRWWGNRVGATFQLNVRNI